MPRVGAFSCLWTCRSYSFSASVDSMNWTIVAAEWWPGQSRVVLELEEVDDDEDWCLYLVERHESCRFFLRIPSFTSFCDWWTSGSGLGFRVWSNEFGGWRVHSLVCRRHLHCIMPANCDADFDARNQCLVAWLLQLYSDSGFRKCHERIIYDLKWRGWHELIHFD